jgi:exodeoxyribonuclease VII large subunit
VPVVSAVGHEIDVTLSDLAADVRALTPSEAAERIVPSVDDLRAALAACRKRLERGLVGRMDFARARLEGLAARATLRRPFDRLRHLAQRLDELSLRAARAARHCVSHRRHALAACAGKLDTLSPLAVLGRGYTLTSRLDDGTLLRSVGQLRPGLEVQTRVVDGAFISRVESVSANANDGTNT